MWLLCLPVLATLLAGCKKDASTAASTNQPGSGNLLTAPVDYMGAVVQAKKRAEKVVDSVNLTQAVQLFYAQEDRFPRDLNELVVKRYVAAIPPAPPGTTWAYNPQTGAINAVRQP
jgi:hypothetical protein